MAIRILTAAAVFVALAAPALADDPDCSKPVSQLNLEQIEDCKNIAKITTAFQHFQRRVKEAQEEERIREERRANNPVDPKCQKENACLKVWRP